MAETTTTVKEAAPTLIPDDIGILRRFLRGRRWYGTEWYITVAGGAILLLIVVITLLAPVLAPFDPNEFAGAQFTLETALFGEDLATFPDYPAEIRAPAGSEFGVSAFQVQFGSTDISTPGDELDVLFAMNPAALKANLPDLEQIEKQLRKLVNVIKLRDLSGKNAVRREMALVCVKAIPENRAEILRIVDIFRCKVVDTGLEHYIIEVSGNEDKLNAFINQVKAQRGKKIPETQADKLIAAAQWIIDII